MVRLTKQMALKRPAVLYESKGNVTFEEDNSYSKDDMSLQQDSLFTSTMGSTEGGESGMDFSDGSSLQSDSLFTSSKGSTDMSISGMALSEAGSVTERPSYVNPVVAEKEKRNIFRSKLLVILVLLIAVATVATAAILLIRDEEERNFHIQFQAYSSETITVVREKAKKSFEAIEYYSSTVTSIAKVTNAVWPFVTIPDFAVRTKHLVNLIGAESEFIFAPIVKHEDRDNWEQYTMEKVASMTLDLLRNSEEYTEDDLETFTDINVPYIHNYDLSGGLSTKVEYSYREDTYAVNWQPYPITPETYACNYNLNSGRRFANTFYTMAATLEPTINFNFVRLQDYSQSQVMQPIFRDIGDGAEKDLVAVLVVLIDWIGYFNDILPEDGEPIDVVLKSTCGDIVTYQINGQDAIYVGDYDGHDRAYDSLGVSSPLISIGNDLNEIQAGQCVPKLSLHVYPTKELEESFKTSKAAIYAAVIVVIFGFTSLVFILYDFFVGRHQQKLMDRVIQQDKIVSNVFPTAIRDRMYQAENDGNKDNLILPPTGLDPDDFHNPEIFGEAPIAEIYPSATVVFADIAGFTAWSSTREPQQVFMLLEALYGAFDKIAYQYNVFKVETVGDCYVAAAGLPEPSDDHAVAAVKFAFAILKKMKDLTHKLELTLGPDTADLDLHIGINSGQVLAGVIRGDRARFQLFGDTINTASRMQSTGQRNKIHISDITATLLKGHGYNKIIKPRKEPIKVKGKGEMQTAFLMSREESALMAKRGKYTRKRELGKETATPIEVVEEEKEKDFFDDEDINNDFIDGTAQNMTKTERLVAYNDQVLISLLQQIIAARETTQDPVTPIKIEEEIGKSSTALEEFIPIIPLRRFGAAELEKRKDPSSIVLSEAAKRQLKDYLTIIAGMYHPNPFHNFEHASHVTSSVCKLLKRIVDVSGQTGLRSSETADVNLVDLAGHSYGITSDPLTQFAVVFSAIIHDVDHPGVTNAQLVVEKTRNAKFYKKSIAEQNSVELAWDLLMSPDYKDLRACIYSNEDELKRFRQLVVNTIMATDICDKELGALRKARWTKAFLTTEEISDTEIESVDRKATIVIEHLIQASDVSHTMQHWNIYKEWNRKLFMEMYKAFSNGRGATDPSIGWYKGEIGFFDFYVIPLAKKLQNCGVFGVSSHEYLNYAQLNREQWTREGKSAVEDYLKEYSEMNDLSDGEHSSSEGSEVFSEENTTAVKV